MEQKRRDSTSRPATQPHLPQQPRKLAAELVADIMQGARQQAEAARIAKAAPPPRRRQGLLLVLLLPLLIGLTAWNVMRMSGDAEVFTPEQQEASIRVKIFLAANAVDHYRDSAGVFPASLATVGVIDPVLTYAPSTTTYSIAASFGTTQLSYRYGDSLAPFAAAFATLRARKR